MEDTAPTPLPQAVVATPDPFKELGDRVTKLEVRQDEDDKSERRDFIMKIITIVISCVALVYACKSEKSANEALKMQAEQFEVWKRVQNTNIVIGPKSDMWQYQGRPDIELRVVNNGKNLDVENIQAVYTKLADGVSYWGDAASRQSVIDRLKYVDWMRYAVPFGYSPPQIQNCAVNWHDPRVEMFGVSEQGRWPLTTGAALVITFPQPADWCYVTITVEATDGSYSWRTIPNPKYTSGNMKYIEAMNAFGDFQEAQELMNGQGK